MDLISNLAGEGPKKGGKNEKIYLNPYIVCISIRHGLRDYLYPAGSIYTNINLPVTATANNGTATKVGISQSTSILGAVAIGDASIEAAKKNGGITKVYHVDYGVKNILGIFGTYTTTVYGE